MFSYLWYWCWKLWWCCQVESLMEMFDGGKMEHEIMEKSGRLSYATTAWESVKPGVFERQITYRFKHHISIFGGEVTCTQHKSPLENDKGWTVNELTVMHDVPFADYFHVWCLLIIQTFTANTSHLLFWFSPWSCFSFPFCRSIFGTRLRNPPLLIVYASVVFMLGSPGWKAPSSNKESLET